MHPLTALLAHAGSGSQPPIRATAEEETKADRRRRIRQLLAENGEARTMAEAIAAGDCYRVSHLTFLRSGAVMPSTRGAEAAVLAALLWYPQLAGLEVEVRLVLPGPKPGEIRLGPAVTLTAPVID